MFWNIKSSLLDKKTIHTHRFQYALARLFVGMSSSRGVESSHRHRYIDPSRIVCLEFHPPEAVEIWLAAIMQNNGIFDSLLKWPQWSFHPRRNITRFLLNPFWFNRLSSSQLLFSLDPKQIGLRYSRTDFRTSWPSMTCHTHSNSLVSIHPLCCPIHPWTCRICDLWVQASSSWSCKHMPE